MDGWGSSPLARGLRRTASSPRLRGRIIPARAGFTRQGGMGRPSGWDHPRSRGVYSPHGSAPACLSGSSPLARGLPAQHGIDRLGRGIIPARAGFTAGGFGASGHLSDHPRSRGVYAGTDFPAGIIAGIIPARAGFTTRNRAQRMNRMGSSPLARGLRTKKIVSLILRRIIPARAGFTRNDRGEDQRHGDHPRSRGVYATLTSPPHSSSGSSPLARGLHVQGRRSDCRRRIIPARAGFTATAASLTSRWTDHPRSRGVYRVLRRPPMSMIGSSPLARGLP